jgi:hydroxyacyl-ACP dehydratase HTD2-like protein with hotdog domain
MTIQKEIPPYRIPMTKVRMMMYAAATWNPYQLHWDSDFSKSRGFADANVAGPMLGDYLAEMLVRWAGDADRLKTLAYTNREMAFPGDTLVCHGEVRGSVERDGVNLIDCRVWAENQTGRVLAEGSATITFPGKA